MFGIPLDHILVPIHHTAAKHRGKSCKLVLITQSSNAIHVGYFRLSQERCPLASVQTFEERNHLPLKAINRWSAREKAHDVVVEVFFRR